MREYTYEVTKIYDSTESVVIVKIEALNRNTALGKIRKMFANHNPVDMPKIIIKKL
jgi:hypothetical protein